MRDAVPNLECENIYQVCSNRLVDALDDDGLDFEGGQAHLKRLFRPIDYNQELK